jgi:pimeloyl-[acyl-carrier protein] methyl ester esterase
MKLYSETFGSGEPLVLLHGWAMHSGIWHDFALALAQHYQVTCVDLAGHGYSAPLPCFDLASITEALAETLPDKPSYWLGWSLGASISLAMAQRFPARVCGVILMAGNPCFMQQPDWAGVSTAVLTQFADQLQHNAYATLTRFLSIQVMRLPEAKTLSKTLKSAVLARPAPDTASLHGGLLILQSADLRPALTQLSVPLLILLGQRDSLVPVAIAPLLAQSAPHAQIHVVTGAAHVPFLSHSDEVVAKIRAFI